MSLPVLIQGAGGHAKVLIEALQLSGKPIEGILEPDQTLWGSELLGIKILGDDDVIFNYDPNNVELVNALGSIKSTSARQRLFEAWQARGYHYSTVIHPKAAVSVHSHLSEGVQVLAGAIINAGTSVRENTIVNTAAVVEHDCSVGAHCHLAPSSSLAGSVTVEDKVHVGLGARVLQEVTLGEACLVAAGAVVVNSVARGKVVLGVPARVRGDV